MLQPKIGDIYMMYFNGEDSVQKGWKPAVILQNNIGNNFSPNVIAAPLTSRMSKKPLPTHVYLSAEKYGLPKNSIVLCEQISTISKNKIGNKITIESLPNEIMREIAIAHSISMPLIGYLDEKSLEKLRLEVRHLNNMDTDLLNGMNIVA